MNEVIVFDDIEDVLRLHLTDRLAEYGRAVPVSATVPTPRPDEFVVVPRIGGPRQNLVVDSPLIGVECWSDKASDALSLAQLTRGLIFAMQGETIEGVTIYRVQEAAGPALLPDPDSAQARYVFTVQLDMRGHAQEPVS